MHDTPFELPRGVLGGGVAACAALRRRGGGAPRGPRRCPGAGSYLLGPTVPLAVGGARSPPALCDARCQPSRGTVGCHDALGSGVAVCAAPLRRGGSAPRRRPGDWHPSGGLLTVGGAQAVAPKA